jgi:Spy/CpxP family protein refolding chaperone
MALPRQCYMGMSLALVLALVGTTRAQKAIPQRDEEPTRPGLVTRIVELLPSAYADQLNLDAQQRQKINELEKEYTQKRKQALVLAVAQVVGIVEDLQRADHREDAPVLSIVHEVTGGLLAERRIRVEYERKLLALLNDEQKQHYAELEARGPEERRARRLARQETRGTRAEAGPWAIFSPEMQQKLHLTPEQKHQLSDLHREVEKQLHRVLTEEQQKRYEELHSKERAEKPSALDLE